MSSLSLPRIHTRGRHSMAAIEARRLARHPAFLVGTVITFGILIAWYVADRDEPAFIDVLPMSVLPAFFLGLLSLVATARITRSTDATTEALATAPQSEARRTGALAIACLVPFVTALLWDALLLVFVALQGVEP